MQPTQRAFTRFALASLFLLAGCGGENHGGGDGGSDVSPGDGMNRADGGTPADGALPDASRRDGAPPDVASADASDGSAATSCTPQAVEACSCTSTTANGTRECLPDGSGFGACDCTMYGRAVYVATTGNDSNPGDEGSPKATLGGALAVVHDLVASAGLPAGGVVIWIAPGVYPVTTTITLGADVSGSMDRPVVVRAQPGGPVRFVGGTQIAGSAFAPLTASDPSYARTDPTARANLRVADLASLGITDFGMLHERGFGASGQHAPLELFVNGNALPLGRWPDIDQNEVRTPLPTDADITLYGSVTPDVTGHYTAMGTNDGVSVFVRDGLVGGLQYRLYRNSWTYMGSPYTAWFLTTNASGYPADTNPWWYLYSPGMENPMQPSAGATGQILWTDPQAANHGFANTATAVSDTVFTYAGTRPDRWRSAPDAWLHGFWKYGWADLSVPLAAVDTAAHTITLGATPTYGIADTVPFYAFNLLEEVTEPGEWYLDRAHSRLYLYPPGDLTSADIIASMSDGPLVRLSNANYIELRGLVLEASRGRLLEINGGAHNKAVGITLRNAGSNAASISGTDNGVLEGLAYGAGAGCISLSGGDRPSLTPANNYVTRSHLHDYGRLDYSYSAAVEMSGVAQRASHNLIHDAPHNAILYWGNEHLIELNDIHDVVRFTSDAGAIYGGRDWGGRGVIIRNNYLHHFVRSIAGADIVGIYLDDCLSGIEVQGNILADIQGDAILHGGGRDDHMTGNVVVRSSRGIASDARCATWAQPSMTPGDSSNLLEKLLLMNYQSPPWSIRYPECAAIPNNYPAIFDPSAGWLYPEGSRFASNVGYQVTSWMVDSDSAFMHFVQTDNAELSASPFVSEATGDLDQVPAVLAVPGFVSIPASQIGIH